jgi:hypothetical protein
MIEGSCHCGAVRIVVPVAPAELSSCNCLICRRIVSDPDGQLVGYVQGDAMLTNWHCARCGCTTHWTPRDASLDRAGVNLRMFDRRFGNRCRANSSMVRVGRVFPSHRHMRALILMECMGSI